MHVTQTELAHGAVLEICGKEIEFKRSLENLRRVESVVGAAASFAARLDARQATQAEIARVYVSLLRGAIDAPSTLDVEKWVFDKGSRHGELSLFVLSLTLGCDELNAALAARNLLAGEPSQEQREEALRTAPFAGTAAPTGRPSSESATASGSLRQRLFSPQSSSSMRSSPPMSQ